MCNNNTFFFIAYAALRWKRMIFIVLSSLETVHNTVQYMYCIFSLLYRLLSIRLKRQNPLLSDVREREKVHCSIQYTLLLLYLMLLMSYLRNLSIKLYRTSVCYTNITF